MENHVFSKISTDNGTLLRIGLAFSEQLFHLTIIQDEYAWKYSIPKEKLKHFAEQHKMSLNAYCEILLELVKTPDSDITFALNDGEFLINRILSNSLKIKIFVCKLEKANFIKEVENIMDNLFLENNCISKKLHNTIKEKNEINQCKIDCEIKLKELVHKKISDENEQFGQFVLILNEKKRRIQHLEELLEAFKSGRPINNPPVNFKIKQRQSKIKKTSEIQKKEIISDSDVSESSQSSDNSDSEEKNRSNNNFQGEKLVIEQSKPCAAEELLDILEDDSQTPSLPKRLKTNTNNDIVAFTVPHSKSSQDEKQTNTKIPTTPEIDLNTQQLLDML